MINRLTGCLGVLLCLLFFVPSHTMLYSQSPPGSNRDASSKQTIQPGDRMYLRRRETLTRNPSPVSPSVTKLNRGTRVRILKTDKETEWVKVKHKKQTGWINRSALQHSQPEKREEHERDTILEKLNSYQMKSDARPSKSSSTAEVAAGVKGLDSKNQANYAKVEGDFQELQRMEKISSFVSDDEMKSRREAFAEEGNLRWSEPSKQED